MTNRMPPAGSGAYPSLEPASFSEINSFRKNYTAVIIGANGGIGSAIVSMLVADPKCAKIIALSRTHPQIDNPKVESGTIDILDEASISDAFQNIKTAITNDDGIDMTFVATGKLHDENLIPEKSWRQQSHASYEELFALNATGPAMVAKYALELHNKNSKTVFAALSARVSSLEDNRLGGWHAYRASKAALNMILKNLAIEAKRKTPKTIIAGLHPGTVDTALSDPFQGNVPDGKLFSPEQSAQYLLRVIDYLTLEDSGHLIAWDGQKIPY